MIKKTHNCTVDHSAAKAFAYLYETAKKLVPECNKIGFVSDISIL